MRQTCCLRFSENGENCPWVYQGSYNQDLFWSLLLEYLCYNWCLGSGEFTEKGKTPQFIKGFFWKSMLQLKNIIIQYRNFLQDTV